LSGIQHYVINGAKVLFLRPRPQPRPPKGVVAPARCAVDGRQLMDAHSTYCSLRCKLEVEDGAFAAHYPSAAEELGGGGGAAAGSTASGAAALASAGGSAHQHGKQCEGGRRVVMPSLKRATPSASAAAAAAAAAASASHDARHDDSSEDNGGWGGRHKRHRAVPSKFANAVMGGSYQAAFGGSGGNSHRGSRPARDDTVSDQAGALAASAGATPATSDAGLAGLHMLNKGAAAAGGQGASSPCSSQDSGRSSTCKERVHHKRKVKPTRAPMQ
jgi:hypothetical protein